ncbi:hypothetical protein NEUTE1DRAFT_60584 [Neurospora tetrasperma FGSC 2508]|uniref:Yeast cell wall synthesis Kre9/Knh1-like N-terminal domain-containing protein n=1 Tax=Neurospora tetrasperma (strain FGSC 2508 / ATCC MYA-4615 / P0657) TaxID=510951 RepID=F8MFS4_NEUT8|nr:uncharacterized protein NEUTE1DRAFT_60584 [Neurospora tetrasperma FGSC 2508]EGO59300.1 hypothetical protein NEUTE1DRAFT_60584 [Neurospora tetrasperma FGSC 2508]EGZ73421.1 hypothetical protein NEUTE2DRAFT_149495 [Neurospora tetrasperma FGSC 2509]
MKFMIATVAAFAATAAALKLTAPEENAKWDLSQTNTIKWDHVDSDPETFQLVLVNHQTGGEVDMTIADKVKTSDGEYKLTNFVATPGSTYSIKAFGTEKTNSGQLAESQTFSVTKSGVSTTTTATTVKPTSSGTPATSSSATPSQTSNAATALGVTFGVAGPLAAVFAMLF